MAQLSLIESSVTNHDGVARSSLLLIVALFVTNLLNYAFNVGAGWLLSVEDYGIFGVSMTIFLVLSIFIQSGFPQAAAKFLAEPGADRAKILRTSFLGNLVIGLIIGTIFWLIISLSGGLGTGYAYIVPVIIITVVLSSPGRVAVSALQGLFNFKQVALLNILQAALRLIFGIILVLLGYRALGAISGFSLGIIVSTLISIVAVRNIRFWKKSYICPEILKYAVPALFGTVGLNLLMTIDLLAIKFLMTSDQMVGYYQSAITLARLPVWITLGMMSAVFSFISRHIKDDNSKKYISISLDYSLLFLIPISLLFIIIPGPLLTLFFPVNYLPGSSVLAIVSAGMGFLVVINVLGQSLQAMGNPRLPAVILAGVAIVQILLLWLLIPEYGIEGAASATTVSCFLCFILMILAARRYGIKVKCSIRLCVCYALMGIILYFMPHADRGLTVFSVLVAGIVYLLSLFVLGVLTREHVEIIISGMFKKENRVTLAILKLIDRGNIFNKKTDD